MRAELGLYTLQLLAEAATRDNLRVFARAEVIRELDDLALVKNAFYKDDGRAFATLTRDGLKRAGARS